MARETEKGQMVTDTFIAEITTVYEIPAGYDGPLTEKDYEDFLKTQYDDVHVRKLKHFYTDG